MEDDEQKYDKFLLVWDMLGLEAAINLDEIVEADVQTRLQDGKYVDGVSRAINFAQLRARFNTQRNYEIYAINLPQGTTSDDVHSWFEGNAQVMADLVRAKGVPLLKRSGVKPVIT